jgi:hypothetical protein
VVSLLSLALSDAAEATAVRLQAIQGLGNLVLVHGLSAVDKVYVRSDLGLPPSWGTELEGVDLVTDQLHKVTLDGAQEQMQERLEKQGHSRTSLRSPQDSIVLKMGRMLSDCCRTLSEKNRQDHFFAYHKSRQHKVVHVSCD